MPLVEKALSNERPLRPGPRITISGKEIVSPDEEFRRVREWSRGPRKRQARTSFAGYES
jgi:hypothetical protein